MELEPGNPDYRLVHDRRPIMPEPLPVRLVAVADVTLPMIVGTEAALVGLYVGLLGFVRDEQADGLVLRAENFRLVFQIAESVPEREEYRPVVVEAPSLAEARLKLIEAEVEHTLQRGLEPGSEAIVLLDPAGNWVEIVEHRAIM